MIWLASAVIFGGLLMFAGGLVMTFVVALRGRDDPQGSKAFRWFGMATVALLISFLTIIVVAMRVGGLRH